MEQELNNLQTPLGGKLLLMCGKILLIGGKYLLSADHWYTNVRLPIFGGYPDNKCNYKETRTNFQGGEKIPANYSRPGQPGSHRSFGQT